MLYSKVNLNKLEKDIAFEVKLVDTSYTGSLVASAERAMHIVQNLAPYCDSIDNVRRGSVKVDKKRFNTVSKPIKREPRI